MKYKIRQVFINTKEEAFAEFKKIGSTAEGAKIMSDKYINIAIRVDGVENKAVNILKQEMLARNGDVAVSRNAMYSFGEKSDIIIFGTQKNLRSFIDKIRLQPFGLKAMSIELDEFLNSLEKNKSQNTFRISKNIFDFKNGTVVMGILNATPDSFFDGGKYLNFKDACSRADKIAGEGAHIIDVGGMSTRPGSVPVSSNEEAERTIPLINHIKKNHDILISIDTFRSEVAEMAVKEGAEIINDISGLVMDEKMKQVAAQTGASLVLMHMKGTPENMQDNPVYEDVIGEIYDFFRAQTNIALDAGVNREKIIIDPGLGFGKTPEHNFKIIKRLSDFKSLGYPILAGASRKSFTGMLLKLPPDERLEGSLAAAVLCVLNGADILRVHDVKETIRAVSLVKAIQNME
ncbi:MAG: dihydropteroate synthase [Candidatus Humimicrobiaceae bacterium]